MFEEVKPNVSSPSMTELMEEFDKGVLKKHRMFDGKIHDACPEFPEFTYDRREHIDRFWVDSYLKAMNTTISHIQDWFTKISYVNKTAFLKQLVHNMADSKKLFDVAYFIGPPLKDSVYARTQFTRSPYDVAAIDHNRSVDNALYETQKSRYIDWFQSLSELEQFNVVIGLAHLGGGALSETVYLETTKILEEKETNLIRQRVLEYLALKRKESFKVLASKVAKRKRRHRSHSRKPSKQPKHSMSHRNRNEDQEDEGEEPDVVAKMKQKIEEFNNALRAMKDVAEGHYTDPTRKLSKYGKRHSKHSIQNNLGAKKKKALYKLDAGLDRLQMLPLWDNRRIMSMLSEKTMNNLVSVNKYWKEMVEKTKKELKTRKKIDRYLNPDQTKPKRNKSTAHRLGSKLKEVTKKHEGSVRSVDSGHKTQGMDEIFMPEDFHGHLSVDKVFSGPQIKLNPYARDYNEFIVCDKYCDDRVFDATKRWAAYSCKMDVEFANVVVGGVCNLLLENAHKTKISCLCFHPDGASIFTGGYDGVVKLHDIWKKAVKLVYAGHKGIVESVTASCRYVASCGMDNQIRVFTIADGRCLYCYFMEDSTPRTLLLTKCGNPVLYVGNIAGELLMYRIRPENATTKIGQTVIAHRGEVTNIQHYPCILITSGVDGYVRMWNTNLKFPNWIVSLSHPTRVNAAVLSYRKIISACEDGKIRIWDVMTSVCERTILVVKNHGPILGIVCINTPSTVKLILSNEADIKVLEFPIKKTPNKKIGRHNVSLLKRTADLKAKSSPFSPPLSSLDRRMMKLQMRQAVLPKLQPPPKKASPQHPLLTDGKSIMSSTRPSERSSEQTTN